MLPSYITFKRTGVNPFRFSNNETAINYVGKAYKLISVFAFASITINAFLPTAITYLAPIKYLENDTLIWVGFALIHLAFVVVFVAQRNMANEWRIGIDNHNKVKLVTNGLFKISRNPIFLGILFVFLGLFLMLPNTATAIILTTGILVMQVQIRLEEDFLKNTLGEEYLEYMSKVKRWLF